MHPAQSLPPEPHIASVRVPVWGMGFGEGQRLPGQEEEREEYFVADGQGKKRACLWYIHTYPANGCAARQVSVCLSKILHDQPV